MLARSGFMGRCLAAALVVCLAGTLPAGASGSFPWLPWYPLVDHPDTGALSGIPACNDTGLTASLIGRFNETEGTYWGGFHNLQTVENLIEKDHRERGEDRLARRWCSGTAVFADGSRRHLVLELAANTEWLGLTYSLAYCIVGLDRGLVYGRNCETLHKR